MTAQITPIQVPLTNGVVRSFGHVRLSIAGLDFTGGFKSIKRSRVRKREKVMSNSPDPVGKTLGENEYECSAVVYYDWWANLLFTVQQNLGPGYGDQPFTIYISYVGVNLNPYTDQVLNCTFDTTQADDQQGIPALTREVDFNPTKILFNGVDDLADPLIAPPQ
jgi:hypothetical protein